jgi:hypothetical protein
VNVNLNGNKTKLWIDPDYMALNFKQNLSIGILILLILAGCSAYHSLPSDWAKDIPGTYQCTSGSYRESVVFTSDGIFLHKFFEKDKEILSESGKWNTPTSSFEIELNPTNHFTQFYDPMSKRISSTGSSFGSYIYFPLPDGKTFFKISPSPNFEYCLLREGK